MAVNPILVQKPLQPKTLGGQVCLMSKIEPLKAIDIARLSCALEEVTGLALYASPSGLIPNYCI